MLKDLAHIRCSELGAGVTVRVNVEVWAKFNFPRYVNFHYQ
jgi:hypothetical protein